jgi:predicted O-methyltransferase YrrM
METAIRDGSEVLALPPMYFEKGSIGYLERALIGLVVKSLEPRLIIETGAFKGHTAKFLDGFARANGLKKCRIVSFDLPEVVDRIKESEICADCMNVEFVAGRLPESLANFLQTCAQPVDFAILDSEHSYEAVYSELELIGKRLKPGGYIFCHDYREGDSCYDGVVHAVDRYARKNNLFLLPICQSSHIHGAALLFRPLQKRKRFSGLVFWLKHFVKGKATAEQGPATNNHLP